MKTYITELAMAAKKGASTPKSSKKESIGTKARVKLRPRKRPGRHAKKPSPSKQTFFTEGRCR